MNGYGHLRTSTGMGEIQIKGAALSAFLAKEEVARNTPIDR